MAGRGRTALVFPAEPAIPTRFRGRGFSVFTASSSGDLLADRRFNYAAALAAAGDAAAAIDLLRQALERATGWAEGWVTLGEWCQRLGLRDDAAAAFASASRLDPQGRLGAGLRLAALGLAPPPDAMPQAYVAALFDGYAPRFERSLVGRLAYAAPAQIVAALDAVRPVRFARAIDLGCGTGLMGEAVRDRVDHLSGIDISAKMIGVAEEKQIYDSLFVGDATAHLANETTAAFDLVLAADVLPYVGDVAPLFTAVASRLAPGGVFAFSGERHDGTGFALGDTLRYRHSTTLIRAAAEASGLGVQALEDTTIRKERGVPVPGIVAVLIGAR